MRTPGIPNQKSQADADNKLLRLYLTAPVTSATSERTFSALRRLKNCMRSTMRQDRLNSCILLHCHKPDTENIESEEIAKSFVSVNEKTYTFLGRYMYL